MRVVTSATVHVPGVTMVAQRAREGLSITSQSYVLDSSRVMNLGAANKPPAAEDPPRLYIRWRECLHD